jgi:protein subunit release factor A
MTLQDAKDEDLEWHAWPPRPVGGQHVGGHRAGVLVVHKPTGIAAVSVDDQCSQLRNREQARAMLQAHLDAHALCGEHRSALVGLLEHAEQRLEDADRPHKVDAARAEIAALRAVLGELAAKEGATT